jgi:menaquinone-dependent protoporphyrinogen oxidase
LNLDEKIRITMKNQTRREFLLKATRMTGTVAIFSALSPGYIYAQDPKVKASRFPSFSCNEESKGAHSILIAYASESGSTVEVAKAIGDALCERGFHTETKWIETVESIDKYDAVIIGSPIIYEKWMPEVRTFVKRNQDILKTKSVAYFMTCLALSSKEESAMQKTVEYSDKLCNLVPVIKPVSIGRFGGVLDYSKISSVNRVLLKVAMRKHKVEEGDYRDWNAIRSWANNIDFQLG